MLTSDSSDRNDDDNGKHRKAESCRQVSVMDCAPCRADDPEAGEPVCKLTYSHFGEAEPSMNLGLNDTRVLVAKLIVVLERFNDPLAERIDSFYLSDGQWPIDSTVGPNAQRSGLGNMKPSRLPQTPSEPLSETEAWRMMRMVRHARDHATFLRFIGSRLLRRPSAASSKSIKQPKRPKSKRRRRSS
jgi:hypothetical protein